MNIKLVILSILSVLFLSGCDAKDYNKRDIEKYVKYELGISDFQIANNPIPRPTDSDDEAWEIFVPIEDITFYVIEDYQKAESSQYFPSNTIRDTLYLELIRKQIETRDFDFDILDVDFSNKFALLREAQFEVRYKNETELKTGYEEALVLQEYLNQKGFMEENIIWWGNPDITFTFITDTMYDNNESNMYFSGARNSRDLSILGGETFNYNTILNRYHLALYEFQYLDEVADLQKPIIGYEIGIYNGEETEQYKFEPQMIKIMPDLYTNFSDGVRIPTFYKILQDIGLSPIGTPYNYTVVGVNGSTYEISYNFLELDKYGDQYVAYYKQNGDKIRKDKSTWKDDYVWEETFLEITGYRLKTIGLEKDLSIEGEQ